VFSFLAGLADHAGHQEEWRARRDLNPQPSAPKGRRGDLYPIELRNPIPFKDAFNLLATFTRLQMAFAAHGLGQSFEVLSQHQFPGTAIFRRRTFIRVVLIESAREVRSRSRVKTTSRLTAQDVGRKHESKWRARRDLNPQPSAPKADALSN
jgi:hypothetical protein